MITLLHVNNDLFLPQHKSTDLSQKADYYQALNLWKDEAQDGYGECRDKAAEIIKDCMETGRVTLNLSDLYLTSLPVLPPHIEELVVSNNALETLPSLPDTLKILEASHNRLKNFPAVASGSSLEELYLADNHIKIKPKSAGTLRVLDLSNNPLCFAIPKIIHHIWLGDKTFPYQAMRNLVRNAALNPDYKIKLYVEKPERTKSELITAGFSSAIFGRVEILKYSASYELEAIILRESAGTPYSNYAAASDVLRLSLLRDFGGIYMDADIVLGEPLGDILIENQFGRPAVDSLYKYDIVKNPDGTENISLNNNVIAALENSKDIDALLKAIKAVYTGKEFTFGHNKTKYMDHFKTFWSDNSGENGLTAQIKMREILKTEEKLTRSGKLAALKLLDGAERNKRLEEMSDYKRNLFSENVDCTDIMWGLKRELPLVRYASTLTFTGPGLFRSYLYNEKPGDLISDKFQNDRENGFHSVSKLIKTDIFGDVKEPFGKWIPEKNGKGGRVEYPMGKWVPENNGNGGWIAPPRQGWSTEV